MKYIIYLKKYIIRPALLCLSGILLAGLNSCELIQPKDIVNPNVDAGSFLDSYDAMAPWRNGVEREFALTVGSFVELTELVSDNYFNNYSQSSKVFDIPQIEYHDTDVAGLQRRLARLREVAVYGIEKVAPADPKTNADDLFSLQLAKAYSYLLAGEYFTGLPMTPKGEVKDWKAQLNQAITEFKSLFSNQLPVEDASTLNVLIARAYYRLGDKTNAVDYAEKALNLSRDFVKTVKFDGLNGTNNAMQAGVYGITPAFQPLPRLDFLDPKYALTRPNEQRPIVIAKAEEAYLIQAEALIAEEKPEDSRALLKTLLALVTSRPEYTVDESNETRTGSYKKTYPKSDYTVAASASDPQRSGLVRTRGISGALVAVPCISGTSVEAAMIDNASTIDDLLELCYLMRQEIFFSEGRRMSDLGIRFPVAFSEASVNPSASGFTSAQIPSFIPLSQDMDAFEVDAATKTVVIKHNMNHVIVTNKTSEYVVPFM
ncbi:hypothetical protein FACS1894123_02980 [Bacteroidia bacterium]|nr:hypothetical protein FACS1894123_02980 [Bacteroidia bacterium]